MLRGSEESRPGARRSFEMVQGRVAIIGGGNMGGALLDGLMKGKMDADRLNLVEVRESVRKGFEERYGIGSAPMIDDAVRESDVIVLAIKPQDIRGILSNLKPHVCENNLILSVAAGITTSLIEGLLNEKQPVARTMPNIAAKIGKSAVAICFNPHVSEKQKRLARKTVSSIGMVIEMDEEKMDAVTGLSGSGPAFVFLMIESLADAGVFIGLARETALALATQTVYGAASLLKETGEHPAVLREKVTSPGGTTAEGLLRLEKGGFKHLVIEAVRAATEKSEILGKNMNSRHLQ
jgi:pyrroline-5-carboxylate reductase